MSRSGGYENIAHRRTRRAKKPIAVTVELVLTASDLRSGHHAYYGRTYEGPVPEDIELVYRHSFALRTAGQAVRSDFEVVDESVQVLGSDGRELFRQTRDGDQVLSRVAPGKSAERQIVRDMVRPFGDRRFDDYLKERVPARTALLTESYQYANMLWDIRKVLGGLQLFQLSPHECRSSGVPTPNAALERHGQNLPAAADHLRRNDAAAWRKVQNAMRSILPDLLSIDIAYTEDRRLALQFKERGIGRPWSAGEVSDGTIQALALFIALFDQRSTMIVVEEPENSVHPWILRQFLDLCEDQRSKQILLTSHSPLLLNYVPASIVRLMSMREGRSQISRVVDMAPEVTDLALSGELSLFDAYDSGVMPESVPRGFLYEHELEQ